MHMFEGPESGVTYVTHGDRSNGLRIYENDFDKLRDSRDQGYIEIPLKDILAFVADYKMSQEIGKLEQLTTDELIAHYLG